MILTFFSDEEMTRATPPFQMAVRQWGMKDDPVYPASSPFRMDFENYTIGRLVPNRAITITNMQGIKLLRLVFCGELSNSDGFW